MTSLQQEKIYLYCSRKISDTAPIAAREEIVFSEVYAVTNKS